MSDATDGSGDNPAQEMSAYERRRWAELEKHWSSQRRETLPVKVKDALSDAGARVGDAGRRAGQWVADVTPAAVKDAGAAVADATLGTVVGAAVHLLELVTDWSVELNDPEKVLAFHRDKGRDVTSLTDLQTLDLEALDEMTAKLALKWRTLGAAQGGAIGALAFVPGPGPLASIGVDLIVMHVLTSSIATRVAYSYGFDPSSPATDQMIDLMVRRAYSEQAGKVAAQRQAGKAFTDMAGRKNWSKKLRSDHKIAAALERLMKEATGKSVPVGRVAKALPAIAVVTGAGINSYVLGDVTTQAIRYSQTVRLSQKHGLPLPERLRHHFSDTDVT